MRRRELLAGLSGLTIVRARVYSSARETQDSNASTSAGWQKYRGNPVIGGKYGTVFDVSVLKEGKRFLLWGSWRPKKSLALFESTNGIKWSAPVIVLGPNPATGWEENINRSVVVKRDRLYQLGTQGRQTGSLSLAMRRVRMARISHGKARRPSWPLNKRGRRQASCVRMSCGIVISHSIECGTPAAINMSPTR